ncbi:cupin domain-containing protein [Micromonospora sp. PLK6-60]|uniref:cupin domain-containing protein n=1 Tax=Micromonospora sp. PLK6-60 TaxID=2873383 RepID=UPI001CA71C10|nr:cupin domain-containing protein [Micromonospora sp. PLK6-60]MBY8873906.1 cupin domain-containing protein [Micromonospora sp. PLK6-60]
MDLKVPGPDNDDPIWTAARGFVVRKDEGPLKQLNGGRERVKVKLTGEQSGNQLSLMEMDVAPGFGNLAHAHGAEDEAFYIASGEFKFINGAGTFEAGAGDFIYIPRMTRHGFKNIGSGTGTLMVFYTPAGAEQFFLNYGDDPDPDGGPAPEWTQERFEEMGNALAAHHMILLPKSGDWD